MALQTAGGFATFGITDGAQIRDISSVLQDAIYYDLHLLGNMNVDFGSPATDILHWWNEDLLNADTVTGLSPVNSTSTTVLVSAADGNNVHIGDLLVDRTSGYTGAAASPGLVLQVTATSVGATVASLTTSWIASVNNSGTTGSFSPSFALIPGEQEGSDIGSDKSLSPTVRNNNTQIFAGHYDVKVTGSQLARQMATAQMQDFVARQLSNRAIELKISLSRAALYGVKSSTQGSATAYRYMGGIRDWALNNSGVTNTASGAWSLTTLDTDNKAIVDKGVFPNTLVVGTDLVGSVTSTDSTNRRLLESDKIAGFTLNQLVLKQGNTVNVIVDSRVNPGDYFLFDSDRFKLVPLQGRGMFVIAAVDFTDAKKRRVLAEWTAEARNPQTFAYGSNKT